jgi:Mn2+/Fe2+ NRAMP family transporter
MAAIQEISARIGRVTGQGIAPNIRKQYSGWVLYPILFLLVVSSTINLGADVTAMGIAVKMLAGGPMLVYAIVLGVILALAEIFIPYSKYQTVLKWLTAVLLAYIVVLFFADVKWGEALKGTFIPRLKWDAAYFSILTALLGTTISPFLFFWQAAQETEEIREDKHQHPLKEKPEQGDKQLNRIRLDTYTGMIASQVVAWAIILTAAATLHPHGIKVQTATDAAKALKPLAGEAASIIFALGIIGTGLLAVPAFAGSSAYAVGGAFGWRVGLNCKAWEAKGFYCVIVAVTLLGLIIPIAHISPMKALLWAAIINGVAAAPIMAVVMLLSHNRKVVGEKFSLPWYLVILGWIATAVMALAAVGMFATMAMG